MKPAYAPPSTEVLARGEVLPEGARDALQGIRIVLVAPSHPGNVGSTARAMKTMGLSRLALVTPRYPDVLANEEARALAAGADDVLAAASIHDSLDEAIGPCSWSMALTVRGRDLGPPVLGVTEGARHAIGLTASGAQVALVFGSERYGLSNAEVQRCQACCSIPTDAQFASLNLAMAVQIATYECRQAAIDLHPRDAPRAAAAALSSEAEREQLFQHLESVLIDIDFLDREHSTKLMAKLRRLFARTALERDEVNILRGICTAIKKASDS